MSSLSSLSSSSSSLARVLQRSITITNASGSTQSYALFAAAPSVTPPASNITNNIIFVLRGVASSTGQAYFTLPKEPLYAVCGTSYDGESTVETQIEVLDTRPIQVGRRGNDGALIPGTTLEMVLRKGTPNFASRADIPPSGNEGCLCIRTGEDFTYNEARAGDFVVGLSLFRKLSRFFSPFVAFRPAPGMEYQIQPSNQFYLAVGDYTARSPTVEGLEKRSCLIDFDKLDLDDVQVHHTEHGRLTVRSDYNED